MLLSRGWCFWTQKLGVPPLGEACKQLAGTYCVYTQADKLPVCSTNKDSIQKSKNTKLRNEVKTAQLSIQKSGNAGGKVSHGNVSLIPRAYAFTVQILIIQGKT